MKKASKSPVTQRKLSKLSKVSNNAKIGKHVQFDSDDEENQMLTSTGNQAAIYEKVMHELLDAAKTRPNTNKQLLEAKAPELLEKQNLYLKKNHKSKREALEQKNYRGIEEIKTWTQKGPEVLEDDENSEEDVQKSKMAKKMPTKKSKAPAKKKKSTSRGTSKSRHKPKFSFNSEINDKVSFEFGTDADMWILEVDAAVLTTDGTLSKHNMATPAYDIAKPYLADETKIMKENSITPKNVGDTVATCGYQLPAYYCIHAHTPIGTAGVNKLGICYKNALNQSTELNCKSIVFPCLGTGGYNVSSDKACQFAMNAVREWMEDESNLASIDRIIFCVYRSLDVEKYMEYIPAYFPIDSGVKVKMGDVRIEDYVQAKNGHKWLQMDIVKTKLLGGSLLDNCTKLKLTGRADSLNDLFFQLLHNTSTKKGLPISELDCTGCYHLTDESVKLTGKIFPELRKVIFDGCSKVTERGLYGFIKHARKLESASFNGCNIGSWNSSFAKQLKPSFIGCPVSSLMESKMTECNIYKVVILRSPSMYKLTPSLSSQFGGNNNKTNQWEGLIRKETRTMGDATVNIIECDVSLLPLVVTPRTIMVMPPIQYDGPYYHRMLSSALSSDYDNPVVLLTQGAKNFVTSIGKRIEQSVNEIMKNVGQLQWKDQRNASQLYALSESMKNRTIIEMKAEQLTVKSTHWKDLFQSMNDQYPEMTEVPQKYLDECRDFAKKSKIGLITEDRLKNGLRLLAILGEILLIPDSNWFIGDLAYFQKLLKSLMKHKNKRDKQKLVPCLPMESNAFSVLQFTASVRDECDLKKCQAQDFLQSLVNSNLYLYLTQPWLNEFDPTPAGIFFASLPKDPPIELSKYWAEHWTDEEQDLIMVYDFLMSPAVPCMQEIMQRCSRFVAPIFVWENGFLGTYGCVEILIELRKRDGILAVNVSPKNVLQNSVLEKYHLVMGTRTTNYVDPSKNKQNLNNAAEVWGKETMGRFSAIINSTFQLMRQTVEYCLLKSNTYFMAKVKCYDCRVDDRVHYYDVLKFTNSDENTVTCNTFKTTHTLADLGLDTYFRLYCDHSAMATTYYTRDKRCALCWLYFDHNPESLYCEICDLCMECIWMLKNTEVALDPDVGNTWGGSTCTRCNAQMFLNSEDAIENHKRWCNKAAELSDWFTISGNKYTMTGIPFILKFDLNLPHAPSVKIQPMTELDNIWIGFQRPGDFNVDYSMMSEVAGAGLIIYVHAIMKYDKRVIELKTGTQTIKLIEVNGEDSAVLLKFTKTGASAFLQSDYNLTQPQVMTLNKGMRFEAKDRKNPKLTAVATIEHFDENGQIKVHFDGWGENFDYFAPITDDDFHSVGYCKQVGIKLDPPKGMKDKEFVWKNYLMQIGVIAVPLEFFNKNPYGITSIQEELRVKGVDSQWQVGMKLEAMDRLNPHLTCVATVTEVLENGKKAKVYFDGWSNNFDYVTETTTPDFHPLNYCAHVGIDLQPPKGYTSDGKVFTWPQYLKETNSVPVPYSLFTRDQTKGCPPFMEFTGNGEGNSTSTIVRNEMEYSKRSIILRSNAVLLNRNLPQEGTDETMNLLGLLPNVIKSDEMEYPKPALTRNFASENTQAVYLLCNRRDFNEYNATDFTRHMLASRPIDKMEADIVNQVGRGFGVHLTIDHEAINQQSVERLDHLLTDAQSIPAAKKSKSKGKKSNIEACPESQTGGKLTVQSNHQLLKLLGTEIAYSLAVFIKAKVAPVEKSFSMNDQWKIVDAEEAAESILRYSLLIYHTLMVLTKGDFGSLHKIENDIQTNALKEWLVKETDVVCPYHDISTSPALRVLSINAMDELKWSDGLKEKTLDHLQNSSQIGVFICSNYSSTVSESFLPNLNTIANFKHLYSLCLQQCELTDFTIYNPAWVQTLKILDLQGNPLREIPQTVFKLANLRLLTLRCCGIAKIPNEITELERLEMLNLSYNILTDIPDCLTEMKCLRSLNLDGVPFFEEKQAPITMDRILEALRLYGIVTPEEQTLKEEKMIKQAKKYGLKSLGTSPVEAEQVNQLNNFLSEKYTPRYPKGQFPPQLCQLKRLRHLNYSRQFLTFLPEEIKNLKQLEELFLDSCPYLEGLTEWLGSLPNFQRVTLQGCPAIKTPPVEIVKKGTTSVLAYLKRLLHGFRECKRTKLMLVGLGGAGKTSLVQALLSGDFQTSGTGSGQITDGIDIVDWAVRVPTKDGEETVNYSVWDFAGQAVYYNTHQFFLSNRAIYLLLWNSRLGYEHAGLDFWLSSISCHATKAPIFVVATHSDQVYYADLPKDEIKEAFPQVVSFHHISSVNGDGVQELANQLFQTTLAQKYMGEKIPTLWSELENNLVAQRHKNKIIHFKTVNDKAIQIGILEDSEVREALLFLHELGSVQYFSNEFLRDRVVINPQWLVDVMADLISVKESAIKDGRFKRKDVSKIWSKYNNALHPWLLRLTEEFDLTYYLPSEDVNIVPCLLPEQEPTFNWPVIEDNSIREMKLTYKFQYLPAGLFNRAQTRLCQYADSSAVWKKGSLLHKNKHIALIRQTRDKELSLTVQGPRPENVLFLVHEVLETLIHEFFQGVSYDLSLPCVDCVNSGSQDPHLFSAKQIRRASDLKAPFLQCGKNFHIVALTALHEFVPPSNTADYAHHLSGMMHDLKELKSNVTLDALFLSHKHDLSDVKNQLAPHRIATDLEGHGITCSMLEANKCKEGKLGMELGVKLSSSLVILTYVSPDFCKDESCSDVYKFIRNGSQKPMIDLVPGLTDDWKKSHVGMLVATEMYVRLRVEKYQHNIQEIVKRIESKKTLMGKSKTKDQFPVFISYCWSNSKEAVMRGTKKIDGAVGPVDPREIDAFLTDHNMKCWLDTRCAREGALFEEIADALRQAKLVIACVSDEYLNSRNCMLEFRFSTGILKLPLILCIVGSGRKWQTSEIALLALGAPRVDFQTRNDSDFDTLLSLIDEELPQEVERKKEKKLKSQKSKGILTETYDEPEKDYSAYQELCELAQRKFLQQVSRVAVALKGVDNAFAAPYPRICFIDINSPDAVSETGSRQGTAQRPGTASNKRGTSALDNIDTSQLVVRILCEFEGGWHCVGEPSSFPQQGIGASEILTQSAAYQSQLFSILQHSPVSVNLLQLKNPQSILLDLKQRALEGNFDAAYKLVSQLSRAADGTMSRGGLLRCSLHSRRIVWLCSQHQKVARDTIANDVLDADDIGILDTEGQTSFKPELKKQPTLPLVLEEDDSLPAKGRRDTMQTTVPNSSGTISRESSRHISPELSDNKVDDEVKKKNRRRRIGHTIGPKHGSVLAINNR